MLGLHAAAAEMISHALKSWQARGMHEIMASAQASTAGTERPLQGELGAYKPARIRGEVVCESALRHEEGLWPEHLVLQELQVSFVHGAFRSQYVQQLLKLPPQHRFACDQHINNISSAAGRNAKDHCQ